MSVFDAPAKPITRLTPRAGAGWHLGRLQSASYALGGNAYTAARMMGRAGHSVRMPRCSTDRSNL
jgi:hypothetical protein